jgi:hypothetical protein
MQKILAVVLLILSSVASAATAEQSMKNPFQEVMITSKMVGTCGVMQQMVRFQEATKMEGGEDFILRFWSTEATRLGMSTDRFIQVCDNSTSKYDVWEKAIKEVE